MASAPHCVTTSVSFVSLVNVNAMIIKNLIEPSNKNFLTSSLPCIGKIACRILVNAFMVVSAVVVVPLVPAVVGDVNDVVTEDSAADGAVGGGGIDCCS